VASLNLHGLEMYDAPCDEDIFDGLNPITFLKCSPSRNALLLLLLLLLLFFERDVENIRFPSLSFPNFDDFIAQAPASEKEEEDKEEEVEQEENNEDALLTQHVVFWRNSRSDLVMFMFLIACLCLCVYVCSFACACVRTEDPEPPEGAKKRQKSKYRTIEARIVKLASSDRSRKLEVRGVFFVSPRSHVKKKKNPLDCLDVV